MSLDGAYDCKANRKMIFNAGMTPNINANKRNRKRTKRGRKRLFNKAIFKERFRTIERVPGKTNLNACFYALSTTVLIITA